MVGLQILDLPIGVRVPASQPDPFAFIRKPQQKPVKFKQQKHLASFTAPSRLGRFRSP